MISRVHVRYFKRFIDQRFELDSHVVLAGPNNSGKTTLLQAIVVWSLALRKFRERRGPLSGSKATARTGVPVTRQDFTALPLRLVDHLWTDTITSLTKEERTASQKAGEPRLLEITLEGQSGQNGTKWTLGFEFRYTSSEQLYVTPINGQQIEEAEELTIVHVPPFSGIGHAETRMDGPYQDYLIGQGKAGDILRNLLLEAHSKKNPWDDLCTQVSELFKVKLLAPQYDGRPHIICEYEPEDGKSRKGRGLPRFDLASAGSGFHQVLLLLAFFYARPATVMLLDEPDAHLHVILQKQIYDMLRRVATDQKCQLMIATHSEVLIDNTDPSEILSFFGGPHRLRVTAEKDQVREALKRLKATDILLAEQQQGVLYVENETDRDLLAAWAKVLGHRLGSWFRESPFVVYMQGRNPREAGAHFFAAKAINPNLSGYVLLDSDNRGEEREIRKENLTVEQWNRYEVESYLVHPVALLRFARKRGALPLHLETADTFLRDQLPPVVYREPLGDHDFLRSLRASKTLLPEFFKHAALPLPKSEYLLVAEQMQADELPPEVRAKLDSIASALRVS